MAFLISLARRTSSIYYRNIRMDIFSIYCVKLHLFYPLHFLFRFQQVELAMPSGGAAEASRSQQQKQSMRESGEDSEDESEILEESPCGRWLKRREEVEQRDVPGIDWAFLAMDTEEGVEVC
jgi:hypothetical protein